ncbi:MAG: hypothetical protein KatS3mg061_2025 [Dehalococcoidia bacterium]|nr:MAG: hypothetical protein KatS3mg061_2025 [Dehalococcoidia bacterium]
MKSISLSEEELRLLHEILSDYLANLRVEIANTDSYELREALKRNEVTLRGLLERLGSALTSP